MLPELVTMENGVLVPSIHCYTLKSLKEIIEGYPKNHLKVLLYVFYKTYPDPEKNPFFNMSEEEKDEFILKEIQADFSTDDPRIAAAITFCDKSYDTPTKKAYRGLKIFMERLGVLFEKQNLTTGKDGSLDSMVRSAEKYYALRESFKGVEKDYNEEIKAITKGKQFTAYDMQ